MMKILEVICADAFGNCELSFIVSGFIVIIGFAYLWMIGLNKRIKKLENER